MLEILPVTCPNCGAVLKGFGDAEDHLSLKNGVVMLLCKRCHKWLATRSGPTLEKFLDGGPMKANVGSSQK